ncbi:MAG: ACP S-malonyltransferase [bacterium]|nr:ACP S-malonyltransferase [bacterium]
MGKTALLFTGQGSQVSGMGLDFYQNFASSKAVYGKFNEACGRSISDIAFYGSDEELKQTVNAQPCILATEIAILEAFKEESDIEISYCAGHSLGEYAALYAAGSIDVKTAAELICGRANAMSKVSMGSMSAIIGIAQEQLQEVIEEASKYGYVDVANYNTPEQTVITGESEAVIKANELALAKGAKRAIPLAVSGAFHSKLMKSAADEFSNSIIAEKVLDAKIPVITNIDAMPTLKAADFIKKMPAQIYSSVQWVKTINCMKDNGVDTFIEIGPSRILSGMVRKTLKEVKVFAITSVSDLENIIEELKVGV